MITGPFPLLHVDSIADKVGEGFENKMRMKPQRAEGKEKGKTHRGILAWMSAVLRAPESAKVAGNDLQ